MSTKVNARGTECQTATSDSSISAQSANADLVEWLADLTDAMERTDWTPEALDAHWNTSRGYAWRLCSGEKSWSVERMLALPDDVRTMLDHLRAERAGRIVVAPPSSPAEGVLNLIAGLAATAGLFSMLAPRPQLPVKTSGPIKAELMRRSTDLKTGT